MSPQSTRHRAGGWLPSIAILVFILGYLVSGYLTLDATTRWVPLLAASVTLLLLIIDLLQLGRRKSRGDVRDVASTDATVSAAPRREIAAILFVAGGVAAIYVLGFLIAIPLYLFMSIAYLGQQTKRIALIVALVTSLIIYIVFEVALAYDLYAGLLFS